MATPKEKINKYFDAQRESYSKESTLCMAEARKNRPDTNTRKHYEQRAWDCGSMVLKMTSIEQQIIKFV